METAMRTGPAGAERDRLREEERLPDEEREADDLAEPDPEEASICLTCGRGRCLLDEDKPCLRYRRAMRALRLRRAGMVKAAEGAVNGGTRAKGNGVRV